MLLTFKAGPLHNESNIHSAKTFFSSSLKANSSNVNTHINYHQILSSVSRVNPEFFFRMLSISIVHSQLIYALSTVCTLEQCTRGKLLAIEFKYVIVWYYRNLRDGAHRQSSNLNSIFHCRIVY